MLTAQKISFEYDNNLVLNKTSFSVSENDCIGLIGPNGSGKSTLLKLLAGKLKPSDGKILRPKELTIGYLPQEIEQYNDLTGLEYLEFATGCKDALKDLEAATKACSTNQNEASLKTYTHAYEVVDSLGAYSLESRIGKALDKVGLESEILKRKISTLSGGQKSKLSLSAILLSKFRVFLLDEPTNNLDLHGLSVLENFIRSTKASFVIISHDRRFLRTTTKKIAELLPSKEIKTYALGYDQYLEAREKQKIAIEQHYLRYEEEKKRLTESARSKMQEARYAATNKSASDNEKIGRNASKEKAAGAHSKAAAALVTRLDQLEQPEKPLKEFSLNFRFTTPVNKVGPTAIDLQNVFVDLDGAKLGPYTFTLHTGDKVVVLGPNGGGKTTFLKAITGLLPVSGMLQLGSEATLGYLDQVYSFPNEKHTVITNLQKMTTTPIPQLLNLLARFNIKKDKANSLPDTLSPGERSRALLAGMIAKGANTLLLDEPTNHLDIAASDELQAALREFKGTLLVVTHDRELIEALEPTQIIVVDDGHILSADEADKYIADIKP